MLDTNALAKYYETLTDAQLLNLKSEGGLNDEALAGVDERTQAPQPQRGGS
jgi:hypothetical protein